MSDDNKTIAGGSIDVTEEFMFNQTNGITNNPMDFMRKMQVTRKQVSDEATRNAIIGLRTINSREEINGDLIATLSVDQIKQLQHTYSEFKKHREKMQKLYVKLQGLNSRAGRLLLQILNSRQQKLEPGKTSLGISREDGTLYIGEAAKVHADPEAAPNVLQGDHVIGKLTKSENRKIEEISLALRDVEGLIKVGEQQDQVNRLNVLKLYYECFGKEFMNDLLKSGERLDHYEFVINSYSNNVRLRLLF